MSRAATVPNDADLASWLRLTLIPGVGGETRRKLLQVFGLPEAIFNASLSDLRGVVGATLAERLLQDDAAATAAIDKALSWANDTWATRALGLA